MPAAKEGTRDHCWWCKAPIELVGRGGYYHSRSWRHVPRNSRELPKADWPVECAVESGYEERDYKTGEKVFVKKVMRAASSTYCGEAVDGQYRSGLCLREIKDPDLKMCGVHAGAELRRRKKDQERLARYNAERAMQDHLESIQEMLEQEYGLKTGLEYKRAWNEVHGFYSGKLTVEPKELLNLLKSLSKE